MADAYDSSPYEQGELAPSPDKRHVQVYSEEDRDELSLSPHEGGAFNDVEEIIEEDKKVDEDGDGSESLDIKPPQTQAGRREKTHKHRHKEERRRDREKRQRENDDKERFGHHRGSGKEKHAQKDAREHIQEKRREKERKRKEDEDREARKREESIRERERLERLERERQRERRMRDSREPKSVEKKRWEDDRRTGTGKGDDRHRHRRREEDAFRSTSRERHHRQGGQSSRERSSDRDQRKVEERGQMRGPHTPEEEYAEGDGEAYQKRLQDQEEGEHSERDLMDTPEQQAEVTDQDSTPRYQFHSGGSSGQRRQSDSQSMSYSHHSAVQELDSPHSSDDETNHITHKLRSKFDDHSSSEEEMDEIPDEEEMMDEDENRVYVENSPTPSPDPEKLPVYYPAFMGCRSVEEFHCLNRIEEGTYGVVYRARCKKTAQIVALKRLKMEKEKEGFPVTALREINTLLKAQHPNIVTVREIVVGSNMDKIYIVMDYVAHDLKSLMESMKTPFSIGETKTLMQQLLKAVDHLHDNWILHRDLKTSNLLLSHNGILKVGDFGLAREYGSPLKSYTSVVVTLWYRAPELLLACKKYSTLIDMWSVGCIFGELLTMKPLWPGKSESDQMTRIFKDLGTPNETIWPGVSELPLFKNITHTQYTYNQLRKRFGSYLTDLGFNLLNKFLTYDPEKRGTAEDCMQDEYFKEAPLPTDPSMFPTWPAKSEQTRKHTSSPKPPSGGKAYAKLLGEDDDTFAGFHMANANRGASAQGPGFQLKF